jgi:hypothetical protein
MVRFGPRGLVVSAALAALLGVGFPLRNVDAQTPDRSDVVLALDFSASILEEPANRNRFGAALERIADRIIATASDLPAGDTTVTIIQFATKAVEYRGCADLHLLGDPSAVTKFADCLRFVASAYRKGLDSALTTRIGVDTNYVAAMERAAAHLPADAVRPTLILFTDGRHDVKGVPASQVSVTRDRLFGTRSPFALLPVGMGLDPAQRGPLEAGLQSLRIVSGMPPCVSGTTFEWPQVVFRSPDDAGNAVAVALQNATCTFTVEPKPTPTPVQAAGPVRDIHLTAGDGAIQLSWAPPASTSVPVVGYRAHCRTGESDWIDATEGQSPGTRATIDGLTNGLAYTCEVAAVGSGSAATWTAATTAITPMGLPAAPAKPMLEGSDRALKVDVGAAAPGVTGYRLECSDDAGGSWRDEGDVTPPETSAVVANLTNGVDYVCRAYAMNPVGQSGPSAPSDAVKVCGSFVDCNGLLAPLVGLLSVILAGGLLAAFVALYRERDRGYVVAIVDVVHVANLGHGSRLGLRFVRDPETRRLVDVVADRGRHADIRIRRVRGGKLEVTDAVRRQVTTSGEAIAVNATGRHSLVLQSFSTNPASAVATDR